MAEANCVFFLIVSGAQSASRIWEDDEVLVFLAVAPLNEGHCLVIPREHYDDLHAVPPERVGHLLEVAQAVSRAAEQALGAEGSLLAMHTQVGQTVFHAHIHVIPRWKRDLVIPFKIISPIRRYWSARRRREVHTRLRTAMAEWQPPSRS